MESSSMNKVEKQAFTVVSGRFPSDTEWIHDVGFFSGLEHLGVPTEEFKECGVSSKRRPDSLGYSPSEDQLYALEVINYYGISDEKLHFYAKAADAWYEAIRLFTCDPDGRNLQEVNLGEALITMCQRMKDE